MENNWLLNAFWVSAAGYALGCINTAYYLIKWKTGGDIRTQFSGNAGATNAGRVLGKKAYAATILFDALKGYLAAEAGWLIGGSNFAAMLALFACILGHIYPIQLGFRGGKGLAAAWGGMWAAAWPVALAMTVFTLAAKKLCPRGSDLAGWLILSFFPLCSFLFLGVGDVSLLVLAASVLMLTHYGQDKTSAAEPPAS